MTKRWRIPSHDSARIALLERQLGVSPVVAQLLYGRGQSDPNGARDFLDAKLNSLRDPDELPGCADAADRIHRAIADGRRIVVYGDYDADGMTGAAILYRCLSLLGGLVDYYTPSRIDDGYGLHDDALRKLAQAGASMVVSVDCGIASLQEAETAQALGLELIVTDHHEFAERLPAAAAIVHPRLPGTAYPFGGLCGAGVAFKLAWALCQRASQAKKVSDRMRAFLLSALGLAALGTVADVVPLVDENRVIVRHGLTSLCEHRSPGIAALLLAAKITKQANLSSEDLAFSIAPRLNAAGRLNHSRLGVELLITESPERATALAEFLEQLNEQRGSRERSIYLAALKQIKERFDPERDAAIVVAGQGWHAGVIGIVASRLVDKFHRPVIVIALDETGVRSAVGSARSVEGVPLHSALAACSHLLEKSGGHAAAAGLTIAEAKIDAFREEFCEQVSRHSEPGGIAELRIDAESPLCLLTLGAVRQIERLAPFGHGNPRPLLCAAGAKLAGPPKTMGQGERHLSARINHNGTTLRAVAFGQGEWVEELSKHSGPIDVAFRPVINNYRERESVELHLVDWRPSQAALGDAVAGAAAARETAKAAG
jgi:single-stranded-DNA-specific exonuclease